MRTYFSKVAAIVAVSLFLLVMGHFVLGNFSIGSRLKLYSWRLFDSSRLPQPPRSEKLFSSISPDGARAVICYSCDLSLPEIVNFYHGAMSKIGWSEKNLKSGDYEGKLLLYSKLGEGSCNIALSEAQHGKTQVIVVLVPSAKVEANRNP